MATISVDSVINSPLKNPFYCGRLVPSLARFPSLIDLNMTCGHYFGRFGHQALPATKPLALATIGVFIGLPNRASNSVLLNIPEGNQ